MSDLRVLVTNDDGIDSPGLTALARCAVDAGHSVTVAAPAQEASGTSASLTAAADDDARRVATTARDDWPVPAYAVAAHPGLIAFTASLGGFGERPDVLLSGINRGANVGRAVLHSGTVGAALTASLYGVRTLAVSLDCGWDRDIEYHWDTAAAVTRSVLDVLPDLPEGTVLNLNVPNVPAGELGPLRRARLVRYGQVQAKVHRLDDGRLEIVTVDPAGTEYEPGTDAALLLAGHPTLTVLTSVADDAELDIPLPLS
ncbi:MAG TPA: 5'/3'-nucleotidase SurE [Pseudonocardiaceae bacterium]